MDLSALDYILLTLIAVIILHILFRTFGGNPKESMAGSSDVKQLMHPINDNRIGNVASLQHTETKDDKKVTLKEKLKADKNNEYSYDLLSKSDQNVINSNGGCPEFVDANQTTDYLKHIAYGGKFLCNNKNEFPGINVKEYQNNFWDFNDKVNANSSGGVDLVDNMAVRRINELHLSGNNELLDDKGTKISDVFSKLTGNEYNQKDTNMVCGRSMTVCSLDSDKNISTGNHKKSGANGNYYTNYDSEVNDGGSLEGYDDMASQNGAL